MKRAGKDITIVATSSMVPVALGAAKMLEEVGHQRRGDRPAHHVAARQAGADRLGQEDLARASWWTRATSATASPPRSPRSIAEGAFYYLDAPVKRMGAMDVPVPFSPVLEDLTVPSEKTVFEAARALCGKKA